MAVTEATPAASVDAVGEDNVALGAAKLTTAPDTGLFPASFTVTCNGAAKDVLITADCGVPPVAVNCAAGPAVFVKANTADSAPADAVAL